MSRELRVLLIEDVDDDATLILRQLRLGGFLPQAQRVDTLEAVSAALQAQSWDVVLCDYSLPGFTALDAFALVRRHHAELPFIIVSGTLGPEKAVECMHAGVSDFILKDRLGRLPSAIEHELAEVALRAAAAHTRKKLRRAEAALAQGEKLRALGQMAAGIAHDLKNLLNPLSMRLQLLDRQVMRSAKEATSQNVQEMRNILRTGVETLERLHAFSRQAPEARTDAVDLNRIAHEAIELARPRLAARSGTPCLIRVELGEPPLIKGNASELLLAAVNLLCNSIDAMPQGGTVTLRTSSDKGGALVQVIDSGTGMTQEVKARIFEPFFTTKGEAGTGLGLAMVYGTVMRHEGTITLTTEVGKGTTFSLWFPALA